MNHLIRMFPSEVDQGNAWSSCFSSHIKNKCSFCDVFGPMHFIILCFLSVLSLCKIAPKHSAEVLSIPRCKKAVICLMEIM